MAISKVPVRPANSCPNEPCCEPAVNRRPGRLATRGAAGTDDGKGSVPVFGRATLRGATVVLAAESEWHESCAAGCRLGGDGRRRRLTGRRLRLWAGRTAIQFRGAVAGVSAETFRLVSCLEQLITALGLTAAFLPAR
jgi:hypothetical protein